MVLVNFTFVKTILDGLKLIRNSETKQYQSQGYLVFDSDLGFC